MPKKSTYFKKTAVMNTRRQSFNIFANQFIPFSVFLADAFWKRFPRPFPQSHP